MITTLKIKSIKKLDSKVVVYDIGVDVTNNFFVGKEQILTGNCDGLTAQAQAALRNTMESFAKYTRFILTANHKHKIIPALQSRCQSLDIKPTIEDAVKRCYNILKSEDIEIDVLQKKKFVELVKANFPDLRKTINEIQKNCINNTLSITNISVDNELLTRIFNDISNKRTLELRRFLIENEERFYGDYDSLLRSFLNYIYTSSVSDNKKKEMIAVIADHLWKAAFILDHEINFFACTIQLERIYLQ
jgi:DNA polymerase III delta prime subunit